MRLSEAPEGEYAITSIERDVKLVLYQLGLVEGTVIEVELRTPTAVVVSIKPTGRIGLSKSTAESVEVVPV